MAGLRDGCYGGKKGGSQRLPTDHGENTMRTLVIILVIVLAAIAISLLMRPTPAAHRATAATPTTAAARQPAVVAGARPVVAPATPAQPELRAAAATGVVADLHTAADYATGYTPLKIKKNTQTKIQAIQDKHNKELEQALK